MSWQNLRRDIVEDFDAVAELPPSSLDAPVPLAEDFALASAHTFWRASAKSFRHLAARRASLRYVDRQLKMRRRRGWTIEPCTVFAVRVCERCGGNYEAREGCNWAVAVHKPPCRG
jgi:hypothetical protein